MATTLDTGHRRWKLWNAPLALSCRLTPPCFEALLDNLGHLAHLHRDIYTIHGYLNLELDASSSGQSTTASLLRIVCVFA